MKFVNSRFLYPSISIIFLLGMGLLILRTLYFGVEPYDEAFYIAMPYHFVLGGKPFVDEYNLTQAASLLIYPFLKGFYLIQGNTEGLILFTRYLYTGFTFLTAAAIGFFLRYTIPMAPRIIIISTCFTFVPFSIHGLSYNTLGMFFLTFTLFLNFYLTTAPGYYKNSLFLSGLFLAFTMIAYPTFILIAPVIFCCAVIPAQAGIHAGLPPQGWVPACAGMTRLFYYFLGLGVGSSWFLVLLWQAGLDQLKTILSFTSSIGVQGGGWAKLMEIAHHGWQSLPHKFIGTASLALLFLTNFLSEKPHFKTWLQLLALAALVLIIHTTDTLTYARHLALLALVLYPCVKKHPASALLFYLVCLPSLMAGLITAWGSSNGVINAAIGFFPAALVTLCYMYFIGYPENAGSVFKYILLLGAVSFFYSANATYADFPTNQLQARMPSGIYAGIYTTENKKSYYLDLAADLQIFSNKQRSILFFDDFPAGYLMTSLQPMTNTVWLFSAQFYPTFNRQATVDYLQQHGMPDMVVQMKQVAQNPNPLVYTYQYMPQDVIQNLLKEYCLVLDKPAYQIYRLGRCV